MARWLEARVWIRPHSPPSLNIYDLVTDDSDNLSRDRFDFPDPGGAASAGKERGLVRRLRWRRISGDVRLPRQRHHIEQGDHRCCDHFHDHFALADDSD